MTAIIQPGRTYNQNHVARPYAKGKRRISIYWTWSYPWEANRDVTELDNRFSSMTEVRRVSWPAFEGAQWDRMNFLQGIEGTLELFHRSTLDFQRVAGEATGQSVAVFQRIDQAGYRLPIDERILADTDTLMVFGLDHLVSEQEAAPEEIEAIRNWLKRQVEYKHHGDELVPRQQRFGTYTRSLMKGLGVPVLNQFGLRPAVVQGTNQIAPLNVNKDLDRLGLLNGVSTFNFHMHLPHYALTEDSKSIHVLARQPIDLSRPHPFTAAGNREFNAFLWMPAAGDRSGQILLADSTIFTTLFGGVESLSVFWRNIALM
jgi:hypothetical protein